MTKKKVVKEVVEETKVKAVIETIEADGNENVLVEDVLNCEEVVGDTKEVAKLEKEVGQDEEKVNAKDIVQENSEIATNDNDSGSR